MSLSNSISPAFSDSWYLAFFMPCIQAYTLHRRPIPRNPSRYVGLWSLRKPSNVYTDGASNSSAQISGVLLYSM